MKYPFLLLVFLLAVLAQKKIVACECLPCPEMTNEDLRGFMERNQLLLPPPGSCHHFPDGSVIPGSCMISATDFVTAKGRSVVDCGVGYELREYVDSKAFIAKPSFWESIRSSFTPFYILAKVLWRLGVYFNVLSN